MKLSTTVRAYLRYIKHLTFKRAKARVRRYVWNTIGNRLANPWSVPFVDDVYFLKFLDYNHFNLFSVKRAADEDNWNRVKSAYLEYRQECELSQRHPAGRHTPMESIGKFTELAHHCHTHLPVECTDLLVRAEELLNHRFSFLGEPPVDLGAGPGWLDGQSDSALWRHHLHSLEFLPLLCRAYHLTGEDRYVRGVEDLLSSWSDSCGYPEGDFWNPHTTALRCSALVETYSLLLPLNDLPHQLHWQLGQEILQQYLFLKKHPEHDLGYNHLIAEYKAMLMTRLAFPEWKLSPSLSVLFEEFMKAVRQQVLPDGGHAERSLFYHLAVARDLLELLVWIGDRDDLLGLDELRTILASMVRFLAAFVTPNGSMVPLGDGFEGYPLTAKEFCSAAAALMQCPELNRFDEHTLYRLWLLGTDTPEEQTTQDKDRRHRAGDDQQHSSRNTFHSFPDTGYWVTQTGQGTNWEVLTWDCGAPGPEDNPGHAHTDALSVYLETEEGPLLADTGTFTYNPGQWRDYFRGTAAHNTARVDLADQALLWKSFRLATDYSASADMVWSNPFFILLAGHHSGYERLKKPVTHSRTLVYLPGEALVISDFFQGTGSHTYELFYHTCLNDLDTADSTAVPFPGVVISDIPVRSSHLLASQVPPGGWVSPGWNDKRPAATHTFTTTTDGPCCLVTYFNLCAAEKAYEVNRLDISEIRDGTASDSKLPYRDAWALYLKRPEDLVHIFIRPAALKNDSLVSYSPVTFGGIETDAGYVMVRKNIGSRTLYFAGNAVSCISDSGIPFMESNQKLKKVYGQVHDETVIFDVEPEAETLYSGQVKLFAPYGKTLILNGKEHPCTRTGEYLTFTFIPASAHPSEDSSQHDDDHQTQP